MLYLYNTLTRKKEIFRPLKNKKVGLYTCGPTVYLYAHLGNLRTYIFEDLLKRVLEYNGYKVKHVMNITDVGHLTSDADSGEDKVEKGARQEKKTVWQIADFYTKAFKKDLVRLNIKKPNFWIKATKTINDQIELIKLLEKKGFTYRINDGIYFDSSKLKTYGRLWGLKKKKLKPGIRVKMVEGKRNPTDFALWKFSPAKTKRQMEWDSPWGKGFPGWHTECVAMSVKKLGIPFDIHCGGIDHISIHHTNEIAQAEAAFGEILAKYWLHGEFLILKKEGLKADNNEAGLRMGKSKGNIVILNSLIDKGFNPLSFRYLCLTVHYRSKLTFSWESLKAASSALNKLYQASAFLRSAERNNQQPKNRKQLSASYKKDFQNSINNDLNIPQALSLVWKMIGDSRLNSEEKYNLLLDFDKVFGLNLSQAKQEKIPLKIIKLAQKREKFRQHKKWEEADKIREKIEKAGYIVEDTSEGVKIKQKILL